MIAKADLWADLLLPPPLPPILTYSVVSRKWAAPLPYTFFIIVGINFLDTI
jgi:hypothetical protein